MNIRCSGCHRLVPVPKGDDPTRIQCPHCHSTVSVHSARRPLLEDLLAEVRQLDGVHQATAATAGLPMPTIRPVSHFSNRTSKAYEKKSPVYRGQLIAVLCGIAVVFIAAYLAYFFIRAGLEKQRLNDALQQAESQATSLDALVRSADTYRAEGEYARALDAYRTVAARARPLLDRLRKASAQMGGGALSDKGEKMAKRLATHLEKATQGLEAPDVKYGAQGLVNLDGKWVTPEVKQSAFESQMRAEGRELYEGEWLTEEEINIRKGRLQYKGRWVSKEEYALLVAAEKTANTAEVSKPTRPVTPPPPAPARAVDLAKRYPPDASEWLFDDFENDGHQWTSVRWKNANPCVLSTVSGSETKRLKIVFPGGQQDKSAIVRPIGMDCTTRSRIRMDVYNDCGEPLRLAIAVQTNTYYESRWQPLKIGMNPDVTFDLTTGDYKCAASHWSPAARIGKLDTVGYLYLLFYNRRGEIVLDNVRALGGT